MSLLRTSHSLVPKRLILQSIPILSLTRSFHTPSPLEAQPRRSPRVKSPSQTPRSTTIPRHQNANLDIEDSLPSISLLKAAQEDGILDPDLDPSKAISFLRALLLSNAGVSKRSGWEERLCIEHNLTPQHLYQLSTTILNPNPKTNIKPTTHLHPLTKTLMTISCALGSPDATLAITHAALQNKTPIPQTSTPYLHLTQLASAQNRQAMTLLGLILLSQNETQNWQEALSLFCSAVGWTIAEPKTLKESQSNSAPPQPRQDLGFDGANECLVQIGKLILSRVSPEGGKREEVFVAQAKEAFRLAAVELDDAEGYFWLAKLEMEKRGQDKDQDREGNVSVEGGDKADYYLDKAVASGVEEAWAVMVKWSNGVIARRDDAVTMKSNRKKGPSMDEEWVRFGEAWSSIAAKEGGNRPF